LEFLVFSQNAVITVDFYFQIYYNVINIYSFGNEQSEVFMAQQVKIIRKGGFFGKLLALLLGIIIGIVAGIGGLAGILYYAFGIASIGEVLGIVEDTTSMDIPAEEYVGEEYLDKTLIQALTDAFGIIGGVTTGANTFGDIAKISPYLGTTIGGLTATLEPYGIELTEEEFMAMSVPAVGEYLQSSFSNLAIAPLITQFGGQAIDPDNAIACSIFYGEKDVHYQVVEENGEKRIEMLPICYTLEENGAFFDATDNIYINSNGVWTNLNGDGVIKAESATSADGTRNYAYAYYTVKDGVEKFAYRLALKEDSTNVYIAYKSDDTEKLHTGATVSTLLGNDLMSNFDNLSISEVIAINEESPKILKALASKNDGKGVLIKDLNKEIKKLTLGEIVEGAESNKILKHLQDSTIDEISEDLQNLTIKQVFADDIYETAYFVNYGTATQQRVYKKDVSYYTDRNHTIPYTGTAPTEQTVLKGIWSYMLTENGIEKDYVITDMDNLVDNVTNNFQSKTLQSLYDDGILNLSDPQFLSTDLNGVTLGSLTIDGLFTKIGEIATAMPNT